jgi:hypothetical protein
MLGSEIGVDKNNNEPHRTPCSAHETVKQVIGMNTFDELINVSHVYG